MQNAKLLLFAYGKKIAGGLRPLEITPQASSFGASSLRSSQRQTGGIRRTAGARLRRDCRLQIGRLQIGRLQIGRLQIGRLQIGRLEDCRLKDCRLEDCSASVALRSKCKMEGEAHSSRRTAHGWQLAANSKGSPRLREAKAWGVYLGQVKAEAG